MHNRLLIGILFVKHEIHRDLNWFGIIIAIVYTACMIRIKYAFHNMTRLINSINFFFPSAKLLRKTEVGNDS